MSSNVGLTTPRGSGTSGYVQRNLSVLKPRSVGVGAPYSLDRGGGGGPMLPPKHRKPDQAILKHDRLRQIEVRVLQLRDELEDEGKLDEEKIEEECEILRTRLVREDEEGGGMTRNDRGKQRKDGFKKYQVHELAEAKIEESERLRRALGLRDSDVGGGNGNGDGKDGAEYEHPMARQERRKREREAERARIELEKEQQQQEQQQSKRRDSDGYDDRYDDEDEGYDHERRDVRPDRRERDRDDR